MTLYLVTHRTLYRYGARVSDGYSVATLMPRSTPHQTVLSTGVVVDPAPDERDERTDQFGNQVIHVGLHHPHDQLEVLATSRVEVHDVDEPTPDSDWRELVARIDTLEADAALDVRPFRASSGFMTQGVDPMALRSLAQEHFGDGVGVLDAVASLSHHIYTTFEFDPSFSQVATPLGDVIAARRGVCQDFAHLMVGALRSMGLAARYVSGYIETEPPEGMARMVGADASHAWCSVWAGDAGWVDVDPTNDHMPTRRHVTVGWGRDYADVAPVRGVVIGPSVGQTLEVAVDMVRLADDC